jgi:putative transposase
VHLVFIPKYRKRVLRGKIAIRLRGLLYEGCRMNRWWIDKLGIQTDHVHLLIRIHPRNSVAEVVQILKGATSRLLRKEFPELEEFLWGDSFWNDGYFAESIGRVDEAVIKRYIQAQHRP